MIKRSLRCVWLGAVVAMAATCTSTPDNNQPVFGKAVTDASAGSIVDGQGAQNDAGTADTSTNCQPACLPGYVCRTVGAGPVCVVDSALACKPCATASGCLGGLCQAVEGEGPFCLIPCLTGPIGDSCPTGYLCKESADDAAERFCHPTTNSCSCTTTNVGDVRSCKLEAAACDGAKTCTVQGWGACSPVANKTEQCDGLDNDCDGLVDEDLDAGAQCSVDNEHGVCPGTLKCHGNKGLVCEGVAAKAEQCDGEDNDCDGLVDDPWLVAGAYIGDSHCGVCGNDCTKAYANGTGACNPAGKPPHCIVAACDSGYVLGKGACVEKAKIGCPGGDCTCKPKDVGSTRLCTSKNDLGACEGFEVCDPQNPGVDGSGWNGCTAKKPKAETCNGVDDDCDGQIDEQLKAGKTCNKTNTHGSCVGAQVCKGSAGWLCDAPTATAEVCDSKDNDCDGATDETWRDGSGLYVSMSHCGSCNKPCEPILTPNVTSKCIAKEGKVACAHLCNNGWYDANKSLVDGCECKFVSKQDEPGGGDANCDGVDGDISKALFVAKHGSDANPGTPGQPFASLAWAIKKATASRHDVYVAGGNYPGNLVLGGVRVFGGYSKNFAVRDPKSYETTVEGISHSQGDVVTLRLTCAPPGKGPKLLLSGLAIKAADAKSPGAASLAVMIEDCGGQIALKDCRIVAGQGANGIVGLNGANGASGSTGLHGKNAKDIGTKNCTGSKHNIGGNGGARVCGNLNVSGGKGGQAVCPDYNNGVNPPGCSLTVKWAQVQGNVEHGTAGLGKSGGVGGLAGFDGYIDPNNGKATACKDPGHSCLRCETGLHKVAGNNGTAGTSGTQGSGGQGCSNVGSVIGGKWVGGKGGDGSGGAHGSGGGGGGASGGVEVVSCTQQAGFSDIGGSGGGGGAGGCAGKAGTGGGPGGASLAIFVAKVSGGYPVLTGNALYGGKGGDGGKGGAGGYGGFGGGGGKGGKSGAGVTKMFCAYGGGAGGNGGAGGHGGGGGGGCGGPSILIAGPSLSGQIIKTYATTNAQKTPGVGGIAGPGGASPVSKGKPGKAGSVAFVQNF